MPTPMTAMPTLTVYFDGSCPLCRREIALYRRSAGAARLGWVDVSAGGAPAADLSCQAAMQRFHVRDAQGHLHSGAAAFMRLWRALPGWRWLGWPLGLPPAVWLLELAYRAFLPLRPRLQRWLARRASEAA